MFKNDRNPHVNDNSNVSLEDHDKAPNIQSRMEVQPWHTTIFFVGGLESLEVQGEVGHRFNALLRYMGENMVTVCIK